MNSSMKYINLEGLTPLQIIQKYEELLLQRENIIKQLSNQLNDSQQKYIEVSETIDLLTTKNKELNEKKLKLDKTLNQQRTDKDLLFIKLNNLISENDKLKNLITGKKETKVPSPAQKGKDKNKDTQKRESKNTINNNENKNIRLELKKEEITITKDNKAQKDLNENKKEDNKDNNKEKETKEKKEEDKKSEEKKENTENSQKSGKSIIELEDNSNKEIKLTTEDTSKTLELPSETQNYTGFVTYETVFDFLIYNYYSMEMKEFDLSLEDLKKMPINSSFIKPLSNFALISEEVHLSFSKNISSKNDILPILTNDKNDIFGFLYLRDYLYFVSNCESNQNLTNEQFLINMYEGIEEGKPYGKERIIFLEYNDETKKIKIKNLLERINGAPEKKIVLVNKEEGNKLEFISLKNIFDVIVEMNNSFN